MQYLTYEIFQCIHNSQQEFQFLSMTGHSQCVAPHQSQPVDASSPTDVWAFFPWPEFHYGASIRILRHQNERFFGGFFDRRSISAVRKTAIPWNPNRSIFPQGGRSWGKNGRKISWFDDSSSLLSRILKKEHILTVGLPIPADWHTKCSF